MVRDSFPSMQMFVSSRTPDPCTDLRIHFCKCQGNGAGAIKTMLGL